MSFKRFDQQTFIIDAANDFARRKISKRDFLKKMGLAGVGFSAFGAGLLGNGRPFNGGRLIGDAAYAQSDAAAETKKWLQDVGSKFKGTKIRYTSETTPPTVVANQIKQEFTEASGIEVEIEIVPLEQVLAKATQDVQGQLGTYDLYYLDQSWAATFAEDTIDPLEYYKSKPELAMPNFDWEDFSKPLMEGLAMYNGKMVGIPFDIPIFILMYRKDILEKHGITVPTTYDEFLAAATKITAAEKGNNVYGVGLQAQSGHYSLECDWTAAVWGSGGSIFNKDKKFSGNDEQGVAGLKMYQELLKQAPPNATASTWDGLFQALKAGQAAMALSWAEFIPGLDSDDSKMKGLFEPARPLVAKPGLRAAADAGFGEIPAVGHQGGSVIGLSKYSKNQDAAWLFMQWVCSKDVMARSSVIGGMAPMRLSSYEDPRVKAQNRVGPGTTRYLDTVKWTIDNAMGSEPDMPLWAGFANNEIPTELGKLLTGQSYDGDAKKCMDALATMIDTKIAESGL